MGDKSIIRDEPSSPRTVNRDLYLITTSYPFERRGGEIPFIEPELPYLESRFRRIIFVPLNSMGPRVDGGKYETDLTLSWRFRSRNPIKAFFGCMRNPHMGKELKEALRLGPRYFKRVIRIGSQITAAFDWARSILLKYPGDSLPVFYSFWLVPAIYGVASRTATTGTITLSRAHGYDVYEDRSPYRHFEFRAEYIGTLDWILPTSVKAANHLIDRYPEIKGKTSILHLGTEEPGLRTEPSTDGTFRIISCSSVIALKRVDSIFSAIHEAAVALPRKKIEWTHIGDGPELSALKDLIASRALPNLIVRTLGALYHSDVFRYYSENSIDLFMNYSTTEGLPISIQEAISFGIPILAVDVGGIGEIVAADTGYLLPSATTVSQLSDAIVGLASKPGELREKRSSARLRWEREFTAAGNYMDFCNKLPEVIRRKALVIKATTSQVSAERKTIPK
jgi:glycosyltransferase involved in cell wall biosynthesis